MGSGEATGGSQDRHGTAVGEAPSADHGGSGASVAGLVPIKDFAKAKGRLAEVLPGPVRATLAQYLAKRVIEALQPLPVAVACDSEAVREWATKLGAEVVWCPGTGLNGAVGAGRDHLLANGFDHVIVCHGDLAHPQRLAELAHGIDAAHPQITLVPDHAGDGTNVIGLPTTVPFHFQYGPRSFARHMGEAGRSGVPINVRYDRYLSLDVDHPVDLEELADDDLAQLLSADSRTVG